MTVVSPGPPGLHGRPAVAPVALQGPAQFKLDLCRVQPCVPRGYR